MNKIYLKSLGRYLAFNSAVWLVLSMFLGNMTVGNFLLSTVIAIFLHKYLIYKG